jgi:hypothetical protein
MFVCRLLNRWSNAPAAIFSNLLGLWPYKENCTLCLVTWGKDWPGLCQLLKKADLFLVAGLLRVASGGTAAELLRERKPNEHDVLQEEAETLRHWQEARARNSAVRFANYVHEEKKEAGKTPFVVMLDADSVLSPSALKTVFESEVLSEAATRSSFLYASTST